MTAQQDRQTTDSIERRVKLVPGGIDIGGTTLPLLAGAVHYWRLDPNDWRSCLVAVKKLGLHFVDTYVPWGVHEVSPGKLELGETDPQRDVARFCRLAQEVGLWVIVRPGPHINAELTYFGLPKRIVWDGACQARSPEQNPVMLPMLPVAFPVPSYASDAYHDEVARYFQLLGPVLAPLLYPNGPIVLLQVDNEGAFYFREGAYDQDYHPDAIRAYRDFLRAKYGTIDALSVAYGITGKEGDEPSSDLTRFTSVEAPRRFDAETPTDLVRHIDWCAFQEHLLTTAFTRFVRALEAAGLSGVPTVHNLPPGQDATPLHPDRVAEVVDLVGQDYYHAAGQTGRQVVARATTDLAARAEALGVPAFASEMGAGFPPFFPPLADQDSAFTVLAALAYGLRGFNVYMAVERDRWLGSPIDRHGRERPQANFWRKLCAAFERTSFATLRRRVPVRILIPRLERRITRAMHAFSPMSGAILSTFGVGARESAIEEELGLGYPLAVEAGEFVHAFERALEARGVPFALVGTDDYAFAGDPRWLLCVSSGALEPAVFERLAAARASGVQITLGPREPQFDDTYRVPSTPYDLRRLLADGRLGPVVRDAASAASAVGQAVDLLGLPTHACDPNDVLATVHEDSSGRARVVFVINPNERHVVARLRCGFDCSRAIDAIDEAEFDGASGVLEVAMRPRSVRMLEPAR
ncbi:MAG: beta-galactosidase [Polyangiaceae bacterium]|nr:beta-galactosidase [Polyangiaceae bacterium]